jgi:hypothetical protein
MLSRIFLGVSLILAAYWIASELNPSWSPFNNPSVSIHSLNSPLDKKSQKVLSQTCALFQEELKKNGLEPKFQRVVIHARDERIQNLPFLKGLYGCFPIEKLATQYLEIEAFTSDFQGHMSDDLQLQVSVYDFVTQNKLTEFGFVYHLPSNPDIANGEDGAISLKQ